MYTWEDIRAAIGSDVLVVRGAMMQSTGCVRQANSVDHKGYVRYFGVLRDGRDTHLSAFSFAPDGRRISGFTCDCASFSAEKGRCAHVAALLIAVLKMESGEAAGSGERSRLAANREAMARRREQIRQEEWRREQALRAAMRFQLDSIIDAAAQRRFASGTREKAALYPILSGLEEAMGLELRIGTKKPYVVRSLQDFAARMTYGTEMVYGKELTFSHREEDVREEDRALLWQIVAMAQSEADGPRIAMTGAALDQTMRLLVGREVDWRGEDGRLVRVKIEPGSRALPVALTREARGFRLSVDDRDVVMGAAGAYFILPQEERILCAFSKNFERIAPLLHLSEEFPGGAPLEADQLPSACANLIAPAAGGAQIVRGEEIVSENMPAPLTVRYYIDIEGKNTLTCRVAFDYGAAQLAPGEESPHIRRDEAAQEAAIAAAKRLFPIERETGGLAFEGSDDACFEMIDHRLASLAEYGEVMIDERLTQLNVKKRSAMAIGVSVSESGMLLVKADLGGLSQEDLRSAYAAYRMKKKYVRLTGGAFLSGEALDQAADAAKTLESMDVTAEQAEKGAEVPAGRALYLESALRERKSIRLCAPKAVTDWIERLQRAQKTRAQNPDTLRATLRDYQLEGLSWLTALSDAGFGGILADDMGLGKTIQALALLLSCKERGESVRALVVCPASLQLNWENEAERFAPTLSVCPLMGGAKARLSQLTADPAPELTIASYDQLRRDVQAYKELHFTHIFLDEAQNIKNAASQAAKSVKTLKADHRFAMTGTPIENRLSELWSIFDFLMPGYLLTYKKFRDRFETPIVREDDEAALHNLRMMTAPFILRRMKADVLHDLPEKSEKIMTSEMTAEQKKIYHAQAAQLIAQADGGFADQTDRIRMLAGLTRLRQICCDPRLCLEKYTGGSGKLGQCLELVRELIGGGHRVLLFSQFTSMLAILKSELQAQGVTTFVLTGDTDKQERMRLVERFNDGGAQVFLISLKAGGTGLNLTGADVVIHYDPWWNTSAQNQATDRAYRIGQKRGVQVFKIIAAGSVEERILKLQKHKSELAGGVLTGEENLFNLDAQALKRLLK